MTKDRSRSELPLNYSGPAPAITDPKRVEAVGSALGQLFGGSFADVFNPPSIICTDEYIDIVRATGLIGDQREHLTYSRVASVRHHSGMIWDSITIESSGGSSMIEVPGLRKEDAERVVVHIRHELSLRAASQLIAAPAAPAVPQGPGRFLIKGVDRESKMDTTWLCHADSEANARAKGDLEGIYVTEVSRVE